MSNFNFPELKGSEKQVKWATDIRNRSIEDFQKYNCDDEKYSKTAIEFLMRDLQKRGYKFEPTDETKKLKREEQLEKLARLIFIEIIERLMTIKDAKFFINHKPSLSILDLFPDLTDLHCYLDGLIPMMLDEKYYKNDIKWQL